MKKGLEKIIEKVILKKYPWIKHFSVVEIKNPADSHKEYIYGVSYYIDYKLLADTSDDGEVALKNLRSETKHVYDVLGPSPSDGFVGSSFKIYKG